jgi:hypothetical protein
MYAETPVPRFAGFDRQTGQRVYREHGQRATATVTRAKSLSVNRYTVDPSRRMRGVGARPWPSESNPGW